MEEKESLIDKSAYDSGNPPYTISVKLNFDTY